jgi:hypothetical protein
LATDDQDNTGVVVVLLLPQVPLQGLMVVALLRPQVPQQGLIVVQEQESHL